MSDKLYDLIVIGGGPAGYLAAERAGEAGLSVLLFEERELGGVCCNEGCIPTKSLLNSAKHLISAKESGKFGVSVTGAVFNLEKAMEWKRTTVESLVSGIKFLMKKGKVEVINSKATLVGQGEVKSEKTTYLAKNIIVACGSEVFVPPIPGADGESVLTSREILELTKLPKSIAIIGGGVIGIEFASFFSAVGVKVDLIEMLDEIIPPMDKTLAKRLRGELKSGVKFHLSSQVTKIDGNSVHFSNKKGENSIDAELILMAVGRRADLSALQGAGLDMDGKGVKVDDNMRTNLPGVFATGDVTGRSLLAHSAYRMAEVAVNTILGKRDKMRYNAVPWAVYTLPEASGCGITEDEAKKSGLDVVVSSIPMRTNGRFLAEKGAKATGFCKLIADKKDGRVLGVHLLGPYSSEMIFAVALIIEGEYRVADIVETIFPHPTVSEVILEAARAVASQIG